MSYLDDLKAKVEAHDAALKNLDMIFGDKETQTRLQNDLQVDWQSAVYKLLPVVLAAEAINEVMKGELYCPVCHLRSGVGHLDDCQIGNLYRALKAAEAQS